ncbi:MAG: right-handed parallel beta-helix repeat-containing protein [Thermoplasmata archaeon]|nr:right-handed parallel beta-helix repeat-containing protein [Thermoplasmata archaeon]
MKHVIRSSLVATVVLVMLASTFTISPTTVSASSTIYIRPDGSVVPSTAPIIRHGNGYKLSANVYDSIYVQRSGITLVGGGYTIQGSGGYGVHLAGISNVKMKNLIVKGFGVGINLENSDNNIILRNIVTQSTDIGIRLTGSSHNVLMKNEVYSNGWNGIRLRTYVSGVWRGSTDNIITGNIAHSNGFNGIHILDQEDVRNSITKNTAYGHYYGITVMGGFYSRVEKNLAYQNERAGMRIQGSKYSVVKGNTLRENGEWGLEMKGSVYNTFEQNMIVNNDGGVLIHRSTGSVRENVIQHNWIESNGIGVNILNDASNNVITRNTITQNDIGARLEYSTYENELHHNNFIGNTVQVEEESIRNIWDDGWDEGNYWSDYTGKDLDRDGRG